MVGKSWPSWEFRNLLNGFGEGRHQLLATQHCFELLGYGLLNLEIKIH